MVKSVGSKEINAEKRSLKHFASSLRKQIITALLDAGLYTENNVHTAPVLKWYR